MKKVFKKIGQILYSLIKNKFLIVISIFIIWISFFDTYNLVDRASKISELKKLRKEKEFFIREIAEYQRQTDELFSNKSKLEKFAREQYLMKSDDEDIFIVVDID